MLPSRPLIWSIFSYLKSKIAKKLKVFGVETDEDSRVCVTCSISTSKQEVSESSDSDEQNQSDVSEQSWLDDYEVLIASLKSKYKEEADTN